MNINNLEEACECFKELKQLKMSVENIKGIAKLELEKVKEWEKRECEEVQEQMDKLESDIKNFYEIERQKNEKFTLSTPWGSIKTRKAKVFEYDDKKMMEYLKANDLNKLIRVKEEINKAEVKKIFAAGINKITGEVVDFIEVKEEETISFKIMED